MAPHSSARSTLERLVPDPLRACALLAQAFPLLLFVLVVVAGIEHHLRFALECEDVCGNAIQKPAVVGDDEHRAGELEQRFFECTQGFDVKVVGRLIQQQHIAAFEQRLGEM